MTPVQLITRASSLAILSLAGGYLLFKKYGPQYEDLAAAGIHIRKSIQELQKAAEVMIFGAGPSAEELKKQRESKRILID